MVEIKNICKNFQEDFWKPENKVLKDLSFKVQPGRIVGFLGANGAGKTTCMRILMGFSSPNSGEVFWHESMGIGQTIFKNIGYLPERPYFYPDLTGKDFVEYMGKLQGMKTSEITPLAKSLGSKFAIDHAFDRKIRGYSKGMLQRIGFVSVLLHDPKFVLLDEPLSGLDPVGRKELKDAIRDLKSQGKTVLLSSHIVSDIEEICDDVVFIDHGKLIFEGTIEELRSQHLQTDVEVSYLNTEKKLITTKMHENELNKFIQDQISDGNQIKKVLPLQKTLENILYETSN